MWRRAGGPVRSWSIFPKTSSSPPAPMRGRTNFRTGVTGRGSTATSTRSRRRSPLWRQRNGHCSTPAAASSIPGRQQPRRCRPGIDDAAAGVEQWLGMLGMHGTYEANLAMHDCDVMVCLGARFDDRITGRLDAFAPHSKKIHIDIDPSSINKNVKVDIGIVGDCAHVLDDIVRLWRDMRQAPDRGALKVWWGQIEKWRGRKSLAYRASDDIIKPQYAIERLYAATKDRDVYITTEVGQHQMWAAQFFGFKEPNRWMTSGGLGTMGYGLPAAVGVQVAHPDSLVIDIAGEASVLMTMQEMSTAAQYRLPIKIFILNNQYM